MSFLGSLFGSGAKDIRKAQQAAEAQRMAGMQGAMGAMDQGASQASGFMDDNRPIYDNARGNALGALNSGYDNALGALKYSNQYLDPYNQTGLQSNNMFADAMGYNGADGAMRAQNSFRLQPGVQGAISEGENAIKRQAAMSGMNSSGGAMRALQDNAINTTNKFYNSWLGNVTGNQQLGLSAAQGMGQLDAQRAGLEADRGNAIAGLETGYGDRLAGINSGKAGIYNNLGDQKASLIQGTYNQSANDTISAANSIAQNRSNRLGTLGSLAGGLFGAWSRR